MKAEFLVSLLQSSVSHDPSEIIIICWFAAQLLVMFLIIINAKNVLPHNIFFWKPWHVVSGFFDEYEVSCDTSNSALITEMKYIFKYVQIENSYFKL